MIASPDSPLTSSDLISDGVREFLRRPLHAVLATHSTGSTGLSQSVVWFHLDGDTVWLSCSPTSFKVRQIAKNPAVSLLVLAPHGGSSVRLDGHATIDETVSEQQRHELVQPYQGAEVEIWLDDHPLDVPNTLVRIRPERIVTTGL